MKSYTHYQVEPSTSWVITHNLNVVPSISDVITDTNGSSQKIYPLNVVHTNNNILTLTFSFPRTGSVRLIGNGLLISPSDSYIEPDGTS